jgi:MFS family permease
VAVLCSFFGGLITGAFWSVAPLAGRALGLDSADVGFMRAMVILGGAAAQLPAGRLSDHTDRRFIIGGLFALGLAAATAGWWLAEGSPTTLYVTMFAIGASVMPIYPLCIATASDETELPLIQIGSAILIMNSIGSILGPLLVAPLMDRAGGSGFFLFVSASMALGVVWTVYRISVVERSRTHEHAFLAVPKSSMVATEMAEETWEYEDTHSSETSP